MTRRLALIAAATAAALALATARPAGDGRSEPQAGPQPEPPADVPFPPPRVIDCTRRVEAGHWPSGDWRLGAVIAGPIAFPNLLDAARTPAVDFDDQATQARRDLEAGERHGNLSDRDRRRLEGWIRTGVGVYSTREVFPIVRADRQVTISVPASHSDRLSLAYDGDFRRGVRAYTFKACSPWERAFSHRGRVGRWTTWTGGMIVRGAQCAPLDFWLPERDRPLRRWVSFGTRGRGCGGPSGAAPGSP